MNEELKQLLRQEFIKTIIEDEDSFEDTNAGFRKFLKRKGSPVFNYKEGGEVKESKKTDAEIEEEIRQNKKQFLNRNPILDFYKGNTLFGLDLGFADKNIGEEFGQYNKKDIRDPRIGLTIIPDVQDETSSKWGISIGPKGGGLTFVKPFSKTGLSGDWEEIPEDWYENNIPDLNVLIPELPQMKDGGHISKGEKVDTNLTTTIPPISGPNPQGIGALFKNKKQYSDLLNLIGKRAAMAYGGLTRTVPPARGPNPQGVETLFKKR